jgi:hypothetical protein
MAQRRADTHSPPETSHRSEEDVKRLLRAKVQSLNVDAKPNHRPTKRVKRPLRAELKTPNIRPKTVDRSEEDAYRPLPARVAEHGPSLTVGASAFFTILLGIVVVGGIAVIIGLRDLAAAFGINWH